VDVGVEVGVEVGVSEDSDDDSDEVAVDDSEVADVVSVGVLVAEVLLGEASTEAESVAEPVAATEFCFLSPLSRRRKALSALDADASVITTRTSSSSRTIFDEANMLMISDFAVVSRVCEMYLRSVFLLWIYGNGVGYCKCVRVAVCS